MKFRNLLIKFTLSSILICSTKLTFAQGNITGVVSDKSTELPLDFVTVTLKNNKDITVKELTTEKGGSYVFTNISYGIYFIKVSRVGYLPLSSSELVLDNSNPKLTFNLRMLPNKNQLKEVVVTSKKQIFENGADRKIYNVDQDLMSKSGTATEILQNVPLVQVDIEGNVSLRNSNVTILINGKNNPLMGKSQSAVLQQLPANSIERIEVITNPSAKYRPDGQGGVINIVLKKNTKLGFNGNFALNGGNSERYNSSIFLNYHPKKVNLFGSYSIRQDYRLRTTNSFRNQITTSGLFSDSLKAFADPFSNIITTGVDFTPNEKNSFGISGNYFKRGLNKDDITGKIINTSTQNENYNRILKNSEKEVEADATFFYEHGFKKEDHLIRLEVNFSHSPETEDNHYRNTYRLPNRLDSLDNTIIKQTSNNKQVTLGYENQINDDTSLELGYDAQFNKQDLDFFGEIFKTNAGKYVEDASRTNRFTYNENIQALYSTFSHSLGDFSFVAGARAEYSDIKSRLITGSKTIPSNYFKIYPTVHFSYDLTDTKSLQFNYSRRVNRPEGDDLNPFAEFRDPTNIRVGNPYLKPELTHSVELGYQWKNDKISIIPGLYYRYKYNGFTSVSTPSATNSNILITTQQNLSSDQAIGGDVVLSGTINKYITSNFTTNLFYNQINASNLGFTNKRSTITWSTNFTSIIAVRSSTNVQINSNYRSARLTPQGKYLPSFVFNLGLRQEVFNKKGSLIFTASDVFKTLRQEQKLDNSELILNSKTVSNSRIFYLGFSYNFGTFEKKRKENLLFDNGL